MVNLCVKYKKNCNYSGGCDLNPSYGIPGAAGSISVSRCAAHKDPGMFSLKQWKVLVRTATEAAAADDGQLPQPVVKRRRSKGAAADNEAG